MLALNLQRRGKWCAHFGSAGGRWSPDHRSELGHLPVEALEPPLPLSFDQGWFRGTASERGPHGQQAATERLGKQLSEPSSTGLVILVLETLLSLKTKFQFLHMELLSIGSSTNLF